LGEYVREMTLFNEEWCDDIDVNLITASFVALLDLLPHLKSLSIMPSPGSFGILSVFSALTPSPAVLSLRHLRLNYHAEEGGFNLGQIMYLFSSPSLESLETSVVDTFDN